MLDAYLYLGKRSPFGRYGGALSGVRPDDLLGNVMKAVVDDSPFEAEDKDDVIIGCGNQVVKMPAVSRGTRACRRPAGIVYRAKSCNGIARAVSQRLFLRHMRSQLAKVIFSSLAVSKA